MDCTPGALLFSEEQIAEDLHEPPLGLGQPVVYVFRCEDLRLHETWVEGEGMDISWGYSLF